MVLRAYFANPLVYHFRLNSRGGVNTDRDRRHEQRMHSKVPLPTTSIYDGRSSTMPADDVAESHDYGMVTSACAMCVRATVA